MQGYFELQFLARQQVSLENIHTRFSAGFIVMILHTTVFSKELFHRQGTSSVQMLFLLGLNSSTIAVICVWTLLVVVCRFSARLLSTLFQKQTSYQ